MKYFIYQTENNSKMRMRRKRTKEAFVQFVKERGYEELIRGK